MTRTERDDGLRSSVGLFYDDMDRFYEAVWGDSLHAGLWEGPDDRATLAEAQDRLTDLFIDRVRLGRGQILLDVGCGTGGPVRRGAAAAGFRAVGLTVSGAQLVRARDLAREAGLPGLAFLMADALDLPFADASFDGAWALESIFHVGDRAQALREIARVMRPGARLVLTDLVETAPLDGRQRGVVRALQVAELAQPGGHARLLASAGLECVETMDLGAAVRRSVGETIRATERNAALLRAAYGDLLYAAIRRLLPELDALYREKLGYVLVVARRPPA